MYGYATVTGRAGKLLDHFGIGRFIQCLPRANPLHAREVVPTSNPRYRWNLGNRSVLDFCTCIGEVGLGVPEYRRLDAIKPHLLLLPTMARTTSRSERWYSLAISSQ